MNTRATTPPPYATGPDGDGDGDDSARVWEELVTSALLGTDRRPPQILAGAPGTGTGTGTASLGTTGLGTTSAGTAGAGRTGTGTAGTDRTDTGTAGTGSTGTGTPDASRTGTGTGTPDAVASGARVPFSDGKGSGPTGAEMAGALLDVAALHTVRRRAGLRPGPAAPPLERAAEDPRRPLPEAARRRLDQLLEIGRAHV